MEHIYGTRQELVQFIGEQTRQIERLRAMVSPSAPLAM